MDVRLRQFSVSQLTIQMVYFKVPWYLMPVTRDLLEKNTESSGGKKIHPSTNVPHHVHLTRPSPYSWMPEDASNQYLIMLKPFNEQSMSLIDGVEWWEMEL